MRLFLYRTLQSAYLQKGICGLYMRHSPGMSVRCPISQLPIENNPNLSILPAHHNVITTAQLSLTILSQVQKTIECVYKGRSPVMYAGNVRRRTQVRNIRESDEVGVLVYLGGHDGIVAADLRIAFQQARQLKDLSFPFCSGGRNQSETWLGCIVSWTTATNSSRNWFKSTSSRNVALKVARVRAASYLRR
jgi:hypothetical protein